MDYFDRDNKEWNYPGDFKIDPDKFNDSNNTNYPDNYDDPNNFDFGDDVSPPNEEPLEASKPSLIERIRDELGITEEEFDRFFTKVKEKAKKYKDPYDKQVFTKSGTQMGCTICIRHYVSLKDEALVFETAFYHFTYGKKFSRDVVTKLHNEICSKLHIGKMLRDDCRSIKNYFKRYLNISFDIVREARKYYIEHPEFIDIINNDKMKKKKKCIWVLK